MFSNTSQCETDRKTKGVEEEIAKDYHSVAVSTGLDADPKYRLTGAIYSRF